MVTVYEELGTRVKVETISKYDKNSFITAYKDWGSDECEIVVSYERLENNLEYESRLIREERANKENEEKSKIIKEREYQLYLKLAKKYENQR